MQGNSVSFLSQISSAPKSATSLMNSCPATWPSSRPPVSRADPGAGNHPCRMAYPSLRLARSRSTGGPDGRRTGSSPDLDRPCPLRRPAHLPPVAQGTPPPPGGAPLRNVRSRRPHKTNARTRFWQSCKTNPIRTQKNGPDPPQRALPLQIRPEPRAKPYRPGLIAGTGLFR